MITSQKKPLILMLASLLILIVVYQTSKDPGTGPNDKFSLKKGDKLMPDLAKNIENVATVTIRSKGMSFKVKRTENGWVMPNKYSYPVGSEKIRDLVQNSADAYVLEGKTTSKESFKSLGLDDPEDKTTQAMRIVLMSQDEKTIYADYIRGLNRKDVSGASPSEVYARLFNSNEAYLAHADLNFDLSADTLLSGETFKVKADNVRDVEVNYINNTIDNFILSRPTSGSDDFMILRPTGNKIKDDSKSKARAMFAALENMVLSDILKRSDVKDFKPDLAITYKTFSGLIVTANLKHADKETWVVIKAETAAGADDVAVQNAARINKLAQNWIYRIDFTEAGSFYYKLADLI